MNIEIPCTSTKKNTHLINGTVIEQSVLNTIRNQFNLKNYVVELHLVRPTQETDRTMASVVSLTKKTRMLEAIGIRSQVYIHPYGVPISVVARAIYVANKNPDTVGIIMQLPLPEYLQELREKIEQDKDIDSINFRNNIWTNCATSEAVLRLLEAQRQNIARIGLVGANGFVGRHVKREIKKRGLGEVVPIEVENSLSYLRLCRTIISAVGCPNLVKAEHLSSTGAHMGVDVGNTKSNGQFRGDFKIENMDGLFEYITPVPGGMGPLEMVILAERIVQNIVDPNFRLNFIL